MGIETIYPQWDVIRDNEKCTNCKICEQQCHNHVHIYDQLTKHMKENSKHCVNCQRCVCFCPTSALQIVKSKNTLRSNSNWTSNMINEINKQATTGGVLLSSMGANNNIPIYWDKILINASQVTNPSIDPLREPMETRVFLGKKMQTIKNDVISPQLELKFPYMFSAMSFGSVSLPVHLSLALSATNSGTFYNCGEGGLHEDLYVYSKNTIVQVASGRFGINPQYLEAAAAIEIKIGQGAKPGIGGHLPATKIDNEVSKTRMIPENSDAISPAPHHDIYSIEDLRQLIDSLKEVTHHKKPILVKVAAVHNIAAIASGVARSGADILVIDGFRGGTGASPTRIRDNVGIPIELALAMTDERLHEEGIRNDISIVVGGSIRNSSDVIKAIALGADACYIATAPLIALGCHLCGTCHTGNCNWGIATQTHELTKRLDYKIGSKRLDNLLNAWQKEIEEFLGGMGINSIEALRGNRAMLRGVNLNAKELSILGIKHAGE